MLNVELELKAEKENAEVRVTNVKDYQVCTLIQDHIRAIEKVQSIIVFRPLSTPSGTFCTKSWSRSMHPVPRLFSPNCQLATLPPSTLPIETCSAPVASLISIYSVQ